MPRWVAFLGELVTLPQLEVMKTSILFILALLVQSLGARVFTNNEGKKIEAFLTEVKGGEVKLAMKGGKSYWVKASTLSKADQTFIQAWIRAGERGGKKAQDALNQQDSLKVEENWDDRWPDAARINPDILIKTVTEDAANRKFVYHSPNYEFISDVKLANQIVKKFAILFETTREYCRVLPISTMKAHIPGALFRNRIYLFGSYSNYVRNGGPPNSGGVYMSRGKFGVILAPLTSMGVKRKGDRYVHDNNGNNDVLPHELTHQLTDVHYFQPGALGWFSEGLAEYVSATPYQTGKFLVDNNIHAIKRDVISYNRAKRRGRGLGNKIAAPDLKAYMLQSYGSFTKNGNFNYGFGLLMTYYFFHLEEDRTSITKFLKALKSGKSGEAALKELRNGRSWEELEEDISKAWKREGITITFK